MKGTKIFISHRSLDADYAATVVDFLEDIGVPSNAVVCTSVPGHLIPNGQKIYDWLRSQFTEYNLHMIFLLSDNYYDSPDCLNEMGAAWVTKASSDVFLLPGISPAKIRGCIGSDTMAIECEGQHAILEDRITLLRNKVCTEFGLLTPYDRRWARIKNDTIEKLSKKKSLMKSDPSQLKEIDEEVPEKTDKEYTIPVHLTKEEMVVLLKRLYSSIMECASGLKNDMTEKTNEALKNMGEYADILYVQTDIYYDPESTEGKVLNKVYDKYTSFIEAAREAQRRAIEDDGNGSNVEALKMTDIAFDGFRRSVTAAIRKLDN